MFRTLSPIQRIAGGELAALAEIYDRYAAVAYGVGVRMLGDEDGAELVVRQTFVELWERAAEVAAAGTPVGAWLLHAVRSRALGIDSAVPNRSPHAPAPLDPAAAPMVHKALANLPSNLRALLDETVFVGASMPEIATRREVPLAVIRDEVRTGLEKLASGLEALLEPAQHTSRRRRRATAANAVQP